MDITQFKDALGDKYDALEAYVTSLVSQRDDARKESIDGRKGLKTEVQNLKQFKDKVFEKLGIEAEEDLDDIQGKPAAAEMEKQLQGKIRRLEGELKAERGKTSDLSAKYQQERSGNIVSRAIAKHKFIDAEVAGLLIGSRVKWEGDDAFYETEDGKLIPVDEGAALIAKTKPHLLQVQGAGGSGTPPPGTGGSVKNPWTKEHFNLTEQGKLLRDNPQLAEQMSKAAQ